MQRQERWSPSREAFHTPWGNPTEAPIRLAITATPGGCEEALRLIATSGDQLDLRDVPGSRINGCARVTR
jgi:hypothetical protein